MRSLPLLANLNNGCRKAAAPNNGVAAFFYSTAFYAFRHTMPLFEESLFAGNTSKKSHANHRGRFACDGEKRRKTKAFVDFSDDYCSIPKFVKKFFQIFAQKCPKGTFQIGIGNERGNKPASRCMRGGENS